MFKIQFFILLVLYTRNSSCDIDAIYDTGKEIGQLYGTIDKINSSVLEDYGGIMGLLSNGAINLQIKPEILKIHEKLNKIEKSLNFTIIKDFIKLLSFNIEVYRCIDTIELLMGSINESYGEFYDFINENHSPEIFQHLTEKITLNVPGHIEFIRTIATDAKRHLSGSDNLFSAINSHTNRVSGEICGGNETISEILIQLFELLMIIELKVNIMLSIANAHRYIDEGWKEINAFTRTKFEEQFGIYVQLLLENLEFTDKIYLRACDPVNGNWIRGENFYELEETFQTTIFHYQWTKCSTDSCNDVWFTKSDKCSARFYDDRTECSGALAECAYMGAVKACALKNGPYKFQYLNSSEEGSLGTNFNCPKDNGYMIEDGSGQAAIFATCACNCYRDQYGISLALMESQVQLNMAITGLRFYRKNNILYLQPRESKLGPNGQFENSGNWISIPKLIKWTSNIEKIDRNNRVFFLDELQLPFQYALTGIKFSKVRRGSVTGFALEIFGHAFNYKTGELKSSKTFAVMMKETKISSPLIFDARNPVQINSKNSPTEGNLRYITIERSTLNDDFGQSTVPFFDLVPIVPNPPSILGGIGIFHKAAENRAGFISLRAHGLNYANFFKKFQSSNMIGSRVIFNKTINN